MRRAIRLRSLLALVTLPCFVAAQEPPPPEVRVLAADKAATTACYVLQLPAGHVATRWTPVLMVLAEGRDEKAAQAAVAALRAVVDDGFAIVCPILAGGAGYAAVYADLRRTVRVEQGALHAAFAGDAAGAIAFLLAHRSWFQTFTAFGGAANADLAALKRLPARRVHTLPASDGPALRAHFRALHAEREAKGVAGEVARVLDDLHDAAATGDEARYFAILPDDAVFLGTDGTERWTGTEFRAFAMPYFERLSAWTYMPLRRHVNLEGDGIAWFDEVLDNASYGECRGSGVLARRGEKWVVRQYNLTVSLPNALAHDVAARIRAFTDGAAPGTTTIVLVRHAEKVDASEDPELSAAGKQRTEALARALRDLPIAAVYTSQFRRTAATVAPFAERRSLQATAVPAADVAGLAQRLRTEHAGHTILACGHSNTVPAILKALGVIEPVTIADDEYDRLFVVTLSPDGARLLSLRYGP